ncbi:hypothetical protein ANO14919_014900 [Xylariales sp. No.14919]|nr:hypothetical protein ANO14919_014900 [Xylariales sp. No.14919]
MLLLQQPYVVAMMLLFPALIAVTVCCWAAVTQLRCCNHGFDTVEAYKYNGTV